MAIDVGMRQAAGRWPAPADTRPLVIGIAGGSGSGKTTIAEAVIESVGSDVVTLIQHDSYYRDLSGIPFAERVEVNFDHPDSLETDLFVNHVRALRAGEAVELPKYDFPQHVRLEKTVRIEPQPVLIIEGILVLGEPALRDLMDLRVYVDTDPDLRLLRRLRRDISERGRSADSVLDQYLATVRPMHLQFVEPSKRYADLIIPEGYNPGAIEVLTSLIRGFLSTRSQP